MIVISNYLRIKLGFVNMVELNAMMFLMSYHNLHYRIELNRIAMFMLIICTCYYHYKNNIMSTTATTTTKTNNHHLLLFMILSTIAHHAFGNFILFSLTK